MALEKKATKLLCLEAMESSVAAKELVEKVAVAAEVERELVGF